MAHPGPIKKTIPTHKSVELAGEVVLEDGRLRGRLNAPQLYEHFLKMHCRPGDKFSMKFVNKRPSRSMSQNNYLHLYLSLIGLSSGHTIEELKAWIHDTILSQGVREVFGETVRVVKSTAHLNISEFAELLNTLEEKTEIPLPPTGPFLLPLTRDEYGRLKLIQKEKYEVMRPKGIKIPKKKK